MSLLSMRKGNGKSDGAPKVPTAVSDYAPKPRSSEPLQLGATSIQSIDQITDMSAVEIERVADQVEAAAHETAEGLRETALRIRRNGAAANKRLANFVRVAASCIDAAKAMQQSVEHRNDPQIEPPRQTALDVLVADIGTSTEGETADKKGPALVIGHSSGSLGD